MITAYVALFLIQVIWGMTFPLVQDSLRFASPLVFVAVRFAIAALLFPLIFWPRAHQINRDILWKGFVLGLLLGGGYVLQTFGLMHTTSPRSGFITALFVPLAPVFAWLLFRAQIQLRQWIAVALATIGIFVMSRPESGGLNLGDLSTIGCALCFALQMVYVNRWVNQSNEIPLTWLSLVFTSLLACLMIPAEIPRLEITGYLVFGITFTAVLGSALAIWVQLRFQPRLPVTVAAVIFSFEPLFAALAAYLFQHHIPPMTTLYGAVFILAGMIISSTTRQKEIAPA